MALDPTASCPCGRIGSYRDCCHGRIDWERLLGAGDSRAVISRLSARGKNLSFAFEVARILQLDTLPHQAGWPDIKRAMTVDSVRAIHEAIVTLWPDRMDLDRILHEQRGDKPGLFIGTHQPQPVMRAVARHALYSDVILVVDPFSYPYSVRDELNPILNPREHRTATLIALRLWWLLLPWIDAGIVRIVRSPADFDSDLALASIEAAKERKDDSPDLQRILAAEIDERLHDMGEVREFLDLSVPDAEIERRAREQYPDMPGEEREAMLSELQYRREQHPFFVEPMDISGQNGEFLTFGAGANYDIAKLLASRTAGHLITDQRYRWKEIELDRATSGIDEERWSAFARALQSADLRFLDAADLQIAIKLREEDKLEDLRLFFRRVWNTVSSNDEFAESTSIDLAAELDERVREAEEGWRTITQDLFKWFSSEGIAAAAAVVTGHADLLPAAATFAGAATATAIASRMRRSAFAARHPASFFVELKRRVD